MPSTRKLLPLGQFADTGQVPDLIKGALNALKIPTLISSDRRRAQQMKIRYTKTAGPGFKGSEDDRRRELELIWLELEEIMMSALPEYTEIIDNKIVPQWARLRDDMRPSTPDVRPLVSDGCNPDARTASPYALSVGNEVRLMRSGRFGRSLKQVRWYLIWSVSVLEMPREEREASDPPPNPDDAADMGRGETDDTEP